MVRVGIVGCGNIGKVHAEVLKNMKHIQIQAFVDKNLENALKLAKNYGGENMKKINIVEDEIRIRKGL